MLKLLITWSGVTRDYTNNLDQASIQIQEELNIPTTFNFNLEPVGVFTVPPARAYVQLLSSIYNISLFTGYVSVPPTQGYVSLDNPIANPGGQRFVYQFAAVSDEYLLNMKAVQFIPSYINRTQGQILKDLAENLCPGFFDYTHIASGDLVPEFDYDPTQSWSEVAKQFADASRYRYKVRDKKIWFQPYGDNFLGIQYNEATQPQSQLFTKQLNTQVLAVPIVNDVLIVGDAEAGNNREDYFLGDGFTGNFPLTHKTFQGTVTMLLQETWQNASLNTQSWFTQDPGLNFDYSAGALNVVTGPGLFPNLGESYLSMKNGVELAGGLQLDHGEFTFNDYCEGIIGGLYLDTLYAPSGTALAPGADLIAGFQVTTVSPSVPGISGGIGGVHLWPWANGALVGTGALIITQQNHNYVLQTLVTAPKYTRYQQKYTTVDGEVFGGVTDAIKGSITFRILDYDIAAATGFFYQPQLTTVSVSNVVLPPFAAYALINNIQLNLTDSYTTIASMPLGTLQACEGPSGLSVPTGLILPMLPPNSGGWNDDFTKYIGPAATFAGIGSGIFYPPPLARKTSTTNLVLGAGFALQDAQYTAGQSADTLAFYAQTLPAAGTPIRLQSFESQAAVSRLQVSGSIAAEAAIVGDDGIRSAIVTNLNPLPRTSEDADNAALAFLADRVNTSYNGTYTIQDTPANPIFVGASGDAQWWPTVGRFLHVNAPYRGLSGALMLVSQITLTVLDMKTETMQWSLQFGSDLNLEKVLHNFVDVRPKNVLTSIDTANPPNPRFTISASSTYLADLNNVFVDITGPISPTGITVHVGDPWAGQIEVRRLDTNWGRGATADYVGTVTGPVFTLTRNQFDEIWYMRPVVGTKTSRRSKVLRVRYPRQPSHPVFVSNVDGVVQFQTNGDIRNIYGFELRTPPLPAFSGYVGNQVVLYQQPVASLANLNIDVLNQTALPTLPQFPYTPMDIYAYFFNADWVYSDPEIVQLTGSNFGNFPYPWATNGAGSPVAQATLDAMVVAAGSGSFNVDQWNFYYAQVTGVTLAGSQVNTMIGYLGGDRSVIISITQWKNSYNSTFSYLTAPNELEGYSSYRHPNFGIKMSSLLVDPNGNVTPQFIIGGSGIPNSFSQLTQAPLAVTASTDPLGGTIVGGVTVTVGVYAKDPQGGVTPLTLETIVIPPGTNTNRVTVDVEFANVTDTGYCFITPYPPQGWYAPASGAVIPPHSTSYTFTDIGGPYSNVPDTRFDHFILQARAVYCGGANGGGINGVTGNVIGFNPNVGATSGQVFPPSGWVGRTATCYGRQDYTQWVPIMDVPIAAVTPYTLDVGTAASILVSGDFVLVRLRNDGISDATISAMVSAASGAPLDVDQWNFYYNQVTGLTLTGSEVNAQIQYLGGDRSIIISIGTWKTATLSSVIRDSTLNYYVNLNQVTGELSNGLTPHAYASKSLFITRGTGYGLQFIPLIDNSPTSFALATPTPFPLDDTTEFLIVNNLADYDFETDPMTFTGISASGQFNMNLSIDNAIRLWMVQVLTADTVGDTSLNQFSPYRLIVNAGFIQGASGFGTPQEVFIVGFGPGGVAAPIPLSGTSNLAIEKIPGTMFGWDAIAEGAPTGADLLFDILKFRGTDPGVSVFADSSQYIRIPAGSTTLQSGTLFGTNNDVKIDDRLQLVVMQVGSTNPGMRATVNLYWKVVPVTSPTVGTTTQ